MDIKKPNTSELYYVQGPTKSLLHPIQVEVSGKIMHKTQSHWTQFTHGCRQKNVFTWSVLDVFAANYVMIFQLAAVKNTAHIKYTPMYI